MCNTAAGRRRYMQYLFPQVLASDILDRYDVWVNTIDNCDIEFFKQLAAKYPKINLIWQPDKRVDGIATINAFYKFCMDDGIEKTECPVYHIGGWESIRANLGTKMMQE